MRGGRRDVVPAPRAVWLDDRLLQRAEQPRPLGEEARLHAHRQQRNLRAASGWLVITPLTQPRVVTLEQAGGVRAHLVRVRAG